MIRRALSRCRYGRAAACAGVGALLLAAGCGDGALGSSRDEPAPDGTSLSTLAAPAEGGGALHLVRLVARGDSYAFEPDTVRIRSGAVVRFVHTSQQPESIVFDSAGVAVGGAEVLSREGALAGPLLTEPGAVWDVDFRDAPPGSYPFASLPHAGFGMRGVVVVTP